MNILKELTEKTKKIFNKNNLEEIARSTRFIERERKITAKNFLETVMLKTVCNPMSSLEDLVCEFYKNDCEISKQALYNKFKKEGVKFLQKVLEQLLCVEDNPLTKVRSILSFVKNIKVIDSTEIKLHKKLEKVFPQVRHQGAAVKLQTLMDVVNYQLLKIEITDSKSPDQGYKKHVEEIKKGDLLIADLGYFCIDTFKRVAKAGGFYLSRYFKNCKIYNKDKEPVDLRNELKRAKGNEVILGVLIGESKMPCYCVAIRLTEEAYRKRQKHLEKERRRNPRLKNKDDDELNKWTIFVTNLPSLSGEDLLKIYRLRWQIELLFKMMKTWFQVRKIQASNQYRALITLYSALLAMAILCLTVMSIAEEEISLYKAGKIFVENIRNFINYFRTRKRYAFLWLKKLLCKFALKESRRNRPSTILAIKGIHA
jgi:hypothetical protein